MSTGHKGHSVNELSKAHIDQAIAELMRRVKMDDTHWVPYLGGYSQDWQNNPEVYFDARFADSLMVGGKQMKPYRYVLIHESIEKCLMELLGLDYLPAHYLATAAEKSVVEADGFSWPLYCTAIKPAITAALKKKDGLHVPSNLDDTPYQQEHAASLLKAMTQSV